MRCIFCKADTSSSRSREHILPESLGNHEHVLPCGVVCDGCNNYFARKLEKPILDSPMFQLLRADMRIVNKRRRAPEFPRQQNQRPPSYRLMGRFLGKVGLEVLASRVIHVHEWNHELVDKVELDTLREYVRFDRGAEDWPFSFRTLYPVNAIFEEDETLFEVLHEYQLLYTHAVELYAVIAILGVEFAMNLGAPTLEGYIRWLEANNQCSPLYPMASKSEDETPH